MATAYISNFSTRYNWVILVHGTTTGENAKNELTEITEKEIGLEETVDKINSIYGNGSKINKKKQERQKNVNGKPRPIIEREVINNKNSSWWESRNLCTSEDKN